jgi:integrase
MSEYLTKRNGYWHFQRRVPLELAGLDKRGIVRHSTKIAVRADRRGARAAGIAAGMNRELEAYWRGLEEGKAQEAIDRYTRARKQARAFGFEYVETPQLVERPSAYVLERLEKLVTTKTLDDASARTAVLGYENRPVVKLSEVFSRFEHQTRNEVKDMSPDQLRRWKNGYSLSMADLITAIGDKDVTAISHTDILDYLDWLEGRVDEGDIIPKTANKYIGRASTMLKTINRKLRLGIPDLFSGMRLQGGKNEVRPPFPTEFVQDRILAEGALMGLNDEARRAVFLIADSGLRLSEAVNLNETTIFLECSVPYVKVMPDGRRVKTPDSIREIPLVGTALAAMRLHPKGFPRYQDKGASFSAYVNGYLKDAGLRPTPKHTVYSLRHTFKDRLIALKEQDSMIEALMGHADDHPKYGAGPSLELKLEVLQRIAFRPPRVL